MQRQRDRDYAKELCASRLAFTLSRTGTSKEDYCRAVGISSSTLSRILNKQTLMSTSTLIETARYFEDTSVWSGKDKLDFLLRILKRIAARIPLETCSPGWNACAPYCNRALCT